MPPSSRPVPAAPPAPSSTVSSTVPSSGRTGPFAWLGRAEAAMARLPWSPIALLGRFSVAAVFWKSGQTKVQGLALDPIAGEWQLGWPSLAPQAVDLFRDEYKLPLLDPQVAAVLAASAEHLLPLLLLAGLFTRWSALALLGMTAVIQVLVYPGAYPTHGVWAAVLLALVVHGPGSVSLDHVLRGRR